MKKNILITSAGKRVVLVKIFQQTLKKLEIEGKVFTSELNPCLSPAAVVSDKCFKLPKVTDPNYIELLLEICIENSIFLIVPTIDTELLILAENKELFKNNNINIIISDLNFIEICRDKRNTGAYLDQLGIRIPKAINKFAPTFPIFAKPYDGSLSKDLYLIKNESELTSEILEHPKLMFMEYIDKKEYVEYSVDIYYGQDNRVKSIIPRERLEIRAGEINKGYTRKNYLVYFLKDRLGYLPGVIGCICLQLFYRKEDNDIVGIEINPRFGGGYPLSYYAGANFPDFLIKEYLLEESIEYSENWLDNTLMLRYDEDIIVYEEK